MWYVVRTAERKVKTGGGENDAIFGEAVDLAVCTEVKESTGSVV